MARRCAPKNIAGAERLARDIAHTEKEIAYYLERLDIIDETVAQGFEDQPLPRQGFKTAIASLRRQALARRRCRAPLAEPLSLTGAVPGA